MRALVNEYGSKKDNGRGVPNMGIKFDVKRVIGISSIVISVITWLINRSWKKEYEPVMLGTGADEDGKAKTEHSSTCQ